MLLTKHNEIIERVLAAPRYPVLLIGAVGSGKSRLLSEFAARVGKRAGRLTATRMTDLLIDGSLKDKMANWDALLIDETNFLANLSAVRGALCDLLSRYDKPIFLALRPDGALAGELMDRFPDCTVISLTDADGSATREFKQRCIEECELRLDAESLEFLMSYDFGDYHQIRGVIRSLHLHQSTGRTIDLELCRELAESRR